MANTTKQKYKEVNEAERRKAISFTKTMQSIDEAEVMLVDMVKADDEPSATRVSAIRVLLDSKFKKLNKLLPDLKAVAMSGDMSGNMVVQWRETKRFDGSLDPDKSSEPDTLIQ